MNNDFNIVDLSESLPLIETVVAEVKRREHYKLPTYFPEEGEYRRELYPKHMEFIKAGAINRERLFIAGNRVGKSILGSYEMVVHLTGLYPDWWWCKTPL